MCKWSAGCGSSSTFNCKNCGVKLCKQCNRCVETGKTPPSGNSAQCPRGNHNFKWYIHINGYLSIDKYE